jgi:hypothetical protein
VRASASSISSWASSCEVQDCLIQSSADDDHRLEQAEHRSCMNRLMLPFTCLLLRAVPTPCLSPAPNFEAAVVAWAALAGLPNSLAKLWASL